MGASPVSAHLDDSSFRLKYLRAILKLSVETSYSENQLLKISRLLNPAQLCQAEANVTTAKDALNKSDTAATAAAETVNAQSSLVAELAVSYAGSAAQS